MCCARCGLWIAPEGQPCPRCGKWDCGFDLGHDDLDRSRYNGAEHSCCNRAAGSRSRWRGRGVPRRVDPGEWL